MRGISRRRRGKEGRDWRRERRGWRKGTRETIGKEKTDNTWEGKGGKGME